MSNYRKGADYERWFVRRLKENNPLLVVRSAGSKSVADVIEIRPGFNGRPWVIIWQLKAGKLVLSKKEVHAILALQKENVDVRIANKVKVNGRLMHNVYELMNSELELISTEPYK